MATGILSAPEMPLKLDTASPCPELAESAEHWHRTLSWGVFSAGLQWQRYHFCGSEQSVPGMRSAAHTPS